jgi:hypothetical protein
MAISCETILKIIVVIILLHCLLKPSSDEGFYYQSAEQGGGLGIVPSSSSRIHMRGRNMPSELGELSRIRMRYDSGPDTPPAMASPARIRMGSEGGYTARIRMGSDKDINGSQYVKGHIRADRRNNILTGMGGAY